MNSVRSNNLSFKYKRFTLSELKTLEWWISRLMRDPLFFIISRLILFLYPEKCIKFNEADNLKFCAPFKIIYTEMGGSL